MDHQTNPDSWWKPKLWRKSDEEQEGKEDEEGGREGEGDYKKKLRRRYNVKSGKNTIIRLTF